MLLAVLAMLAITIAFLGAAANNSSAKLERRDITTTALAQAKTALLAYSISRDDIYNGTRPGEFPCPTLVAPGTSGYGTAATGCVTRRIGRLPWQTLGIPELFDASGEPLWYALSSKFNPSTTTININTRADIVLYATDGITVQQPEVVAMIFAAGAPLDYQNRSSVSTASCAAASATTLVRNVCADNYLDSSAGRNNASNAGPYIAAMAAPTFNDAVVSITTSDFMPEIERRIGINLVQTLKAYYINSNSDPMKRYYPNPVFFSDVILAPSANNRTSCSLNNYQGRFPEYINQVAFPPFKPPLCVGQNDWPSVGLAGSLPSWFFVNQWHLAIYYAVGKAYVLGGTKLCLLPGDCLTVDTDPNVQAIVMLPGTQLTNQNRPSNSLTDYFEIPENLDGWSLSNNYVYKTAPRVSASSDRVIAIKN